MMSMEGEENFDASSGGGKKLLVQILLCFCCRKGVRGRKRLSIKKGHHDMMQAVKQDETLE